MYHTNQSQMQNIIKHTKHYEEYKQITKNTTLQSAHSVEYKTFQRTEKHDKEYKTLHCTKYCKEYRILQSTQKYKLYKP